LTNPHTNPTIVNGTMAEITNDQTKPTFVEENLGDENSSKVLRLS